MIKSILLVLLLSYVLCFFEISVGQQKGSGVTYPLNEKSYDTFPTNNISHTKNTSNSNSLQIVDSVEVTIIYIKGKVPVKVGQPDTLTIKLKKNIAGLFPIDVRIKIDERFEQTNLFDTTYTITQSNTFDTLLRHALPKFTSVQHDLVIVEALPGKVFDSPARNNFFDSKQYCQDITYDTYNYADPCLNDDGGVGFAGQTGNFVAAFFNNDTAPFLIGSVDHAFFDSVGGGNHPYKIVVYGDNGNGKPGPLLYISPQLFTPPGTGSAQRVVHEINTLLSIPSGVRFYVGYKQTTFNNIAAAFQHEIPVRTNSFFYTTPENNNFWIDFSDSLANFRLDISVVGGSGLMRLSYIQEGFYNTFSNKLNMSDSLRIYLRQPSSPYNIIDSTIGKIDSITFTKNFTVNTASNGSYFVSVKHRNCIETWSKTSFTYNNGTFSNYNFVNAATQAYGDNVVLVNNIPARYAAYSGDANQDGVIDLSDIIYINNNIVNFINGYVSSDVNGDKISDLIDLLICYNNTIKFISKIIPP